MASEQRTKWYDTDLTEVDSVLTAKETPTTPTIRHARKMVLLPSVTSVIGILGSYSLEQWKIEQAIRSCVAFPFDGDETEENVLSYIDSIKGKSVEYSEAQANRGKLMHAAVANWLMHKDEPEDPVNQEIAWRVEMYLKEAKATNISCERPFGSRELGYAGTPDISADIPGGIIILDLKGTTTKNIAKLKTFRSLYDSWKLQLGGYDGMFAASGHASQLVQVVADMDGGEPRFIEYEDPELWRAAFQHLFDIWCTIKSYDPRKEQA